MRITESKLRQIIRTQIIKTLSETKVSSAKEEEISNQFEKLPSELLSKLQKDLKSLEALAKEQETDIAESKEISQEVSKSTLEKMLDSLRSGGELNIPASATNALLITPILAMKGEFGAASISAAVGLLLDLVANAIQNKLQKPA